MRTQRVTQLIGCQGHLHLVRTRSLILRTPTRRETRIATACGSDEEAQRWLGWEDGHVVGPEATRAALVATPAEGKEFPNEPVLPHFWRLVAIDPRTLAIAGEVGITGVPGEPPQVGGWLAPAYRGRGLGRELFAAGLALGHEHIGIKVLRAGAEASNTPSRRSLEAAGFHPIPGTPTHKLPNGRTIAACWYEHAGPAARCRGVLEAGLRPSP